MAVAGFSSDEITLTAEPNKLTVLGKKEGDDPVRYLHRGIANRAFKQSFDLADYVKVTGASLENGLLSIDLVRELPEEMRPRRIEIQAESPSRRAPTNQIEHSKAA
jgi:molecular chaperone IbpA